jgi:WD40 repeat protein
MPRLLSITTALVLAWAVAGLADDAKKEQPPIPAPEVQAKPPVVDPQVPLKQEDALPLVAPKPVAEPVNREPAVVTLKHRGSVLSVAFAADGQTVLTGSQDRTARTWNSRTGLPIGDVVFLQGDITAMAIAGNRKTLLTGLKDGTVTVWDLATGKARAPFPAGAGEVRAVAFHPDNQGIAAAYADGSITLLDFTQGKQVLLTLKHGGAISGLIFSPDGKRLISTGLDHIAKVWDVAMGQVVLDLKGHTDEVRAVTITPDGQMPTTGGADRTVRIWDSATGNPLHTLPTPAAVVSVIYSPDMRYLAAGCADGQVRLWLVRDQKVIATFHSHEGSVATMDFSPDAETLLTGSTDTTAKLWKVSELVARKEASSFWDRQEKVQALLRDGEARLKAAKLDEALAAYKQAIELQQKSVAAFPDKASYRRELARSHYQIGGLLRQMRMGAEAEQQLRQARSIQQQLVNEDPMMAALRHELARSLLLLGEMQLDMDKLVEAEQSSRQAVQLLEMLAKQIPEPAVESHPILLIPDPPDKPAKQIPEPAVEPSSIILEPVPAKRIPVPPKRIPEPAKQIPEPTVEPRSILEEPAPIVVPKANPVPEPTVKESRSIFEEPASKDFPDAIAAPKRVEPRSIIEEPVPKDLPAAIAMPKGSEEPIPKDFPAAIAVPKRLAVPNDVGIEVAAVRPDLARAYRLLSAVLERQGKFDEAKAMQLRFEEVKNLTAADALRLASVQSAFSRRITEIVRSFSGKGAPLRDVAFSADGKRLAAAGRRLPTGETPGKFQVWDALTGAEIFALKGYGSVAFRPDGRNLASVVGPEEVQVWDAITGKEGQLLKVPGGDIHTVLYSPDGRFLAASSETRGDNSGAINIWDATIGRLVRTLRHADPLGRLAYSPDGKHLAAECSGGTVDIWDVTDGTDLWSLMGRIGSFSPDGTRVAIVGENYTNEVWDVAAGRRVLTLEGANSKAMAYNPNGKLLACAGAGGVKLWNAATGQPLALLTPDNGKPDDNVSNLAFSADGKYLAGIVDRDNTVKVWCLPQDISTGKPASEKPDSNKPASGNPDAPVALDALLALKMSVKLIPVDTNYDVDHVDGVTSRDAVIIAQRRLAELAKKQP